MDLHIHDEKATTIRSLEPGTHYIRVGALRKHGIRAYDIRIRQQDPFRSKTLLGTHVVSFPSEKVYIVEVL